MAEMKKLNPPLNELLPEQAQRDIALKGKPAQVAELLNQFDETKRRQLAWALEDRPELLTGALEAVPLPDGRGHAYLSAELRVTSALRAVLLGRGLGPGQLSPKPYWRRGVANAAHGEPPKD